MRNRFKRLCLVPLLKVSPARLVIKPARRVFHGAAMALQHAQIAGFAIQ
jgi:hypothetical protein